jgi:Na+/H+ antiporter NhaD/arsenite permease-like protein
MRTRPTTARSCTRSSPLRRIVSWICLLAVLGLWLVATVDAPPKARAAERAVTGRIVDAQGAPVAEAGVALYAGDAAEPLAEAHTQPDGAFLLIVPELPESGDLVLVVERPHFATARRPLAEAEVRTLRDAGWLVLDDLTLARQFGVSFWITAAAFALMLFAVATERLHKTLAALAAVAVIFGVSLVGGALNPNLFIFDFERSLEYVDFDVIFLLMGMMIVIGVIEETGVFQWLAYRAYRLSRGRIWLLSIILMTLTAVASALLDNVTTMLLIAPITLQIALAVGIDPLSLLLPEVFAANVGGISTLIGTPTNILVGSYAGLGFNDFLLNLTPGVVFALIGLFGYTLIRYWREYKSPGGELSAALLDRLRQNAAIEDMVKLRKAGIVFGVLLLLFIFGEPIHLPPAVSAIIGAVAMLIWVHPDIEQMMAVVDWTTLMFFIALFMVIGAVQEVGLISLIAGGIGRLVAGNLTFALLAIVWMAALLSGVVDNIPFAAAMLPVVDYLTQTIPGAGNMMLFYGLSVGAAMGGNSSLIGASPNLVTAGIAARAGYPISFKRFLAAGLPSVLVTVALGCAWLFIHFF